MAQHAQPPNGPSNASLMLTKMIRLPLGSFQTKDKLPALDRITTCTPSEGYKKAYARWFEHIHELPGRTLAVKFTVDGRMIVGIGAANILESSLSLNRLWGMPLIPGSGLKGLVSHHTRWLADNQADSPITEEHLRELFGTTDWAGCVNWLDAWFIPDPGVDKSPFTVDVVTVHHQSWYQNPANPPSDFEDPIPSNFISVRGSFLIAVNVLNEAWAIVAMELLKRAVEAWGVGAKTNAGYGYLRCEGVQSPWRIEKMEADNVGKRAEAAEATLQRVIDEINNPVVNALNEAENWVEAWEQLDNDDQKTEIGRLIFSRFKQRPRVYHKITGRVIQNYHGNHKPARDFVLPLLEWMDEHAPEVSQP